MKKSDIVNLVAARTEFRRKDVSLVMDAAFEIILTEVAKGKRVMIPGFGSFEARDRAAKHGTDPRNGKDITIAARRVPFFFASKVFKEAVWTKEE